MSSTELSGKATTQPKKRLTGPERQAIIAAVAMGTTKAQLAQEFGVHPNTISNICEAVHKLNHPANPMAKDLKSALVHKAGNAISRALDSSHDVYRAADIGVKVMTGLGEFVSGTQTKVDAVANIVVQWGRADEPTSQAQVIDVTPVSD